MPMPHSRVISRRARPAPCSSASMAGPAGVGARPGDVGERRCIRGCPGRAVSLEREERRSGAASGFGHGRLAVRLSRDTGLGNSQGRPHRGGKRESNRLFSNGTVYSAHRFLMSVSTRRTCLAAKIYLPSHQTGRRSRFLGAGVPPDRYQAF